jgi:hypothetical protein
MDKEANLTLLCNPSNVRKMGNFMVKVNMKKMWRKNR